MSLHRLARSGVLAATLFLTACQLSQPVAPAAAPAPVAGPIRGTVRLPGGAPAAGAAVTAFPSGADAASPAFTTVADAAGGFVLPVGAGRYNLIATQPGKTWRAVRFQVLSATAVDIDLTPTGSITGQLTGIASPLGAQVFVPGTDLIAVADALGNFTLSDVPAGTGYTLTAQAPGYVPVSVSSLDVTPAAATSAGAIALGRDAGTVAGTVSAPEELGPSGVRVELTGGGRRYTATTAADGSFQLAGVVSGPYTLSFERLGLESDAQELVVAANQATSLPAVALRYAMLVRKVPLDAPLDQVISYPRRGYPLLFRSGLRVEDGRTGQTKLSFTASDASAFGLTSPLTAVYADGTLYSFQAPQSSFIFRNGSRQGWPSPIPTFDRLYSGPQTALLYNSTNGNFLALDEQDGYLSTLDLLRNGNYTAVPRRRTGSQPLNALDLAADSTIYYVDASNALKRQALYANSPANVLSFPSNRPVIGLARRPMGGAFYLTSADKAIFLASDVSGPPLSTAIAAGTFDVPPGSDALKLDAYGNAWVLTSAQKLLSCYTPQGRLIARVQLESSVAFSAETLWKALATDGDGNVWVSDTGGSYVFKISRVLGAD